MPKIEEPSNFSSIRKSLFPLRATQGNCAHFSERRPTGRLAFPANVKVPKKPVQKEQKGIGFTNSKPPVCASKPSLGFLRPTLSSLAKSKPHIHCERVEEFKSVSVFSPEPQVCEALRDASEEICAVEVHLDEIKLVKEAGVHLKISPQPQPEDVLLPVSTVRTEEPEFSISSNSFIIWGAHDDHDDSLDLSRIDLNDHNDNDAASEVEMMAIEHDHHNTTQKENIVATPKYPCTKSAEKKTKRKLYFRSGSWKLCPKERFRTSRSPPPDFDVTINSAPLSPDYILPAPSYDIFSTPILNLSSASSEDIEKEETIYYTPCAEV